MNMKDNRRTVDVPDHQVALLRSLKPGDKFWHQPPGRTDWSSQKWSEVVSIDDTPDGGRRLVVRPLLDRGVLNSIVQIEPERPVFKLPSTDSQGA